MSSIAKTPRVGRSDSGGSGYEHPPPQEANVPALYLPDALLRKLTDPEVRHEIITGTPPQECTWCQMHGATSRVEVEWSPADRPDVPRWADACLGCAHQVVAEGLRDVAPGFLVRVTIALGETTTAGEAA